MNRITIEDLMEITGHGKRTTISMVRAGNLPGFMHGRHYACSPGEFQKWLDGDWQYTGVRSTPPKGTRKPTFIHDIKKESAA